jgi:hypothetical protein
VIRDVAAGRARDPLHRIDDVLVEAREQPEAVLAREIGAAVGTGERDRLLPPTASPAS